MGFYRGRAICFCSVLCLSSSEVIPNCSSVFAFIPCLQCFSRIGQSWHVLCQWEGVPSAESVQHCGKVLRASGASWGLNQRFALKETWESFIPLFRAVSFIIWDFQETFKPYILKSPLMFLDCSGYFLEAMWTPAIFCISFGLWGPIPSCFASLFFRPTCSRALCVFEVYFIYHQVLGILGSLA